MFYSDEDRYWKLRKEQEKIKKQIRIRKIRNDKYIRNKN